MVVATRTQLEDLWNRAVSALRQRLERDEFDNWILPLVPLALTSETLEISVPNKLFASWLEENYLDLLTSAWMEAHGEETCFTFTWSGTGLQGELFHEYEADRAKRLPPRRAANPSGLIERYDFENFIVGPSNQFARAAAMAVAQQPGTLYNPFFLYGGVGLGKTHLANAIGHALLRSEPEARVLFLSADTLTNQLIEAIARNKAAALKNRLRRVDVLIVDDVQFLAGRERTQEEFFHIFNALYENGRQIVLTSDKFPSEIPGVEERLCNRFGWGLVADIQIPDMETRVAILDRKALAEGVEISLDVASLIARSVDSNIRDLEGALTRISAHASLSGRTIDRALAEEVLGKGRSGDGPTAVISLDEVEKEVASHFGLRIADLRARRRTKKIAEARQVAMYLMRQKAGASYPVIGAHLGGRDHSTVIHACQQVERRRKEDSRMRLVLEAVSRRFGAH
ncbi:MAG TPA: chromosomal replication initiator protein DnaA [Candidatus Binatia bacterium]